MLVLVLVGSWGVGVVGSWSWGVGRARYFCSGLPAYVQRNGLATAALK